MEKICLLPAAEACVGDPGNGTPWSDLGVWGTSDCRLELVKSWLPAWAARV